MDWFAAVDIYCERTGPGFWAEPFNALSNLAFPLAALSAARAARRRGLTSPLLWLLIVMAALIGLGSFLFHTLATRWSELADTLPIWSFVAVYVLVAMYLIGGMAPARVARVAAIALVIGGAIAWFATGERSDTADPLHGSGQYAPALVALVVFAAVTRLRHHAAAPWALAATLVFLASLVARTLDIPLCPVLPVGTHLLWHLLNGLMAGILLHLLIATGRFAPHNHQAPADADPSDL